MNDLEALLQSTEAIGDVRLVKMERGWYACLDLPAPAGCEAKVASDFGHATPRAALEQALARLAALRRDIAPESPARMRIA